MNSDVYEQIQPMMDVYRLYEDLIRMPPAKATTQSGTFIDLNL